MAKTIQIYRADKHCGEESFTSYQYHIKIGTRRVHVSAKKCDSHFHHLL